MPASFRRALAPGECLVLTQLDQCLAAYPPGEWARLEAQLAAMPDFARPVKALTRLLASRAADCALDVQGRILVPPSLRRAAGLSRDVVVIGVLRRFEIWAPEAWAAFARESERLLDDVAVDLHWPPVPTPTPGGDPGSPPGLLPPLRPQGKPKR